MSNEEFPSESDADAASPNRDPAGDPPLVSPTSGGESQTDFQIIQLIGNGAYGEVYLARDRNGGYKAVKVIFRESFDHDRPFEREYEGLRRFEQLSRSYDNQIKVFHVGRREDPQQFYYIMELADDQENGQNIRPETYVPRTLSSELKRRGRLPAPECLRIATGLVRALESLHENGLIHRDIKPANIIFVNNRPKLADIGLVTHASVSVSHVGTEGFIPPEGPGSPQSDIYSLGKVLYEMVTGHHRMDYPGLPTDLHALPDRELLLELNAIITKACEPDPRRRYQSAREMLSDLLCLDRGDSVRRKRQRKHHLILASKWAVAICIAGLLFLGFQFVSRRGKVQHSMNVPDGHAATNIAPVETLRPQPNVTAPVIVKSRSAEWWRDARFGMFIHWGLYSIPADATLKNGSRNADTSAEWYMANKEMSVTEYEQLARRFNPVKFNARDWASAARNAGMKYIVITAKHHDGFCMFDTQYTPFNVVRATPFRRDPIKDLAAECARQDLKLCFYYSIRDWHHPDYLPRPKWDRRPTAGADFNRYLRCMNGQVEELLTHYGPIGYLWFDGTYRHTTQSLKSDDIADGARMLQPNVMINNLLLASAGRTDFDSREQFVPLEPLSGERDWESTLPMNDSYGYDKADRNWKSSTELIRRLCRIVHGGGNFLLNVGPTSEGLFPPDSVTRLAEIGVWMKLNGDAIYGTVPGPFRKLPANLRCTAKGNRLYLMVFDWPTEEVSLDGLRTEPKNVRALHTGERLQWKMAPGSGRLQIARPSEVHPAATVVELQFDNFPDILE